MFFFHCYENIISSPQNCLEYKHVKRKALSDLGLIVQRGADNNVCDYIKAKARQKSLDKFTLFEFISLSFL